MICKLFIRGAKDNMNVSVVLDGILIKVKKKKYVLCLTSKLCQNIKSIKCYSPNKENKFKCIELEVCKVLDDLNITVLVFKNINEENQFNFIKNSNIVRNFTMNVENIFFRVIEDNTEIKVIDLYNNVKEYMYIYKLDKSIINITTIEERKNLFLVKYNNLNLSIIIFNNKKNLLTLPLSIIYDKIALEFN